MRVSIIGAGNMGRGIATRAVAGGHEVEIVANDPAEAKALADDLGGTATAGEKSAVGGEIVILAVYYPATLAAIEEYGDQLAGKVVVEISNPIDFETMDGLAVSPDTSGAEEAAKALPSGTPVVGEAGSPGPGRAPGTGRPARDSSLEIDRRVVCAIFRAVPVGDPLAVLT